LTTGRPPETGFLRTSRAGQPPLLPLAPYGRPANVDRNGVPVKNRLAAALDVVVGLAGGTAIGVALGGPGLSDAQTPTTPTTPAPSTTTTASGGVAATTPSKRAGSNEDPTHEAAETPAQEAAEDNGSFHH